jgi:rubrerythrin
MSVFFSGGEILEMAMGIEKNGIAFYDTLAEKSSDKDIRSLYTYLSDEEKKHLISFRNMAGPEGKYVPGGSYPGEYMRYLKSLIDSVVFTDIANARRLAENAVSDYNAIDTGIQAEKDSILFYSELRNIVSVPDRKIVDSIIEAEKDHLRQLSELKVMMKDKEGDNGSKKSR